MKDYSHTYNIISQVAFTSSVTLRTLELRLLPTYQHLALKEARYRPLHTRTLHLTLHVVQQLHNRATSLVNNKPLVRGSQLNSKIQEQTLLV